MYTWGGAEEPTKFHLASDLESDPQMCVHVIPARILLVGEILDIDSLNEWEFPTDSSGKSQNVSSPSDCLLLYDLLYSVMR